MKNNLNLFALFKESRNKLKTKQIESKDVIRKIDKAIRKQKDFEDIYLQLAQIKAYSSLEKTGTDVKKIEQSRDIEQDTLKNDQTDL